MENQILLPEEIIYDTLLRLPVDCLVRCKLVCRTWRTLIDDPTFVDYHARKTNRHLMGFIRCRQDLEHNTFHIGEYNDDQRSTTATFQESESAIEHRLKGEPNIVGSCNGLVCFCRGIDWMVDSFLDMTVVNPLSGEYVNIPRYWTYKPNLIFGFGYEPSTKEYKIVIIRISNETGSWMDVNVYTLGTGRWRSSRKRAELMVPRTINKLRGLHVDGALHWIHLQEPMIYSFDLAKEEFRALLLPPTEGLDSNRCKLGVLEGCLSVKFPSKKYPNSHDIWIKKEKTDEWVKKFNLPDITIVSPSISAKNLDYFNPLGVSRCGKLVLEWCCPRLLQLVCYDSETAYIESKSFDNTSDIIPYSKSLVSPKAERKRIRSLRQVTAELKKRKIATDRISGRRRTR